MYGYIYTKTRVTLMNKVFGSYIENKINLSFTVKSSGQLIMSHCNAIPLLCDINKDILRVPMKLFCKN